MGSTVEHILGHTNIHPSVVSAESTHIACAYSPALMLNMPLEYCNISYDLGHLNTHKQPPLGYELVIKIICTLLL